MVSPFILHCFPFSLTGEQKGENHWRGVDELYVLYLLRHAAGQMHVCLIASAIKIITKHIAVMYRFKSTRMGWFNVETSYMRVLGLWSANTAGSEIVSNEYNNRSEDRFIMYWFTSQAPDNKHNASHSKQSS